MGMFLNIYLKDFKENKYILLDQYQEDIRDSFRDVLNSHTKNDENENSLALPLSQNEINNILSYINDQIKFKEESIVRNKEHIDYITKSNGSSLQEKLEAIELEEDDIVVNKLGIQYLQYTKDFYIFLSNLNYFDTTRIYAGIDCYAPDGSDIPENE